MEDSEVLNEDVWNEQLSELIGLASTLEENFRLITAPSALGSTEQLPEHCDDCSQEDVSPSDQLLELSTAGPPTEPGLFSFEMMVHVDTPSEGLTLRVVSDNTVRQGDQNGVQNGSSSTQPTQAQDRQTDAEFKVHHLPPLQLTITLPPAYPAVEAPHVEISAMWLSEKRKQQLQAVLQQQWENVGPCAVCYDMHELLKSTTLQELDIAQSRSMIIESFQGDMSGASRQSSLTSHSHGESASSSTPQRTQSQSVRPPAIQAMDVAISMSRYSIQRDNELFQNEMCTCPICFGDFLGEKCVRLPECKHYTCAEDFRQYVRTQVVDGAVESIRCVDASCRAPVPVEVIKTVLSQEEFERWEQLLLQRSLDKMSDITYCPRCHTATLEDPQDHCAQCNKCFYVFCGLCDDAWHPGSKCTSPDMVMERKRERLERSGNMSSEEKQRRHADLVGQYKSVAMIYSSSKQCPCCKMAIQKSEGCNKMVCSNCNTKFCYRCLQIINDYDHFGSNRCELFDQQEVQRWEAQMNNLGDRYYHVAAAGYMVQEARRQPGQQRFARCATCGQYNMKHGRNNLIRCYACASYFCYLCHAPLARRPGLHFGVTRCKQHTDD